MVLCNDEAQINEGFLGEELARDLLVFMRCEGQRLYTGSFPQRALVSEFILALCEIRAGVCGSLDRAVYRVWNLSNPFFQLRSTEQVICCQ